jgi:hypothetical protein
MSHVRLYSGCVRHCLRYVTRKFSGKYNGHMWSSWDVLCLGGCKHNLRTGVSQTQCCNFRTIIIPRRQSPKHRRPHRRTPRQFIQRIPKTTSPAYRQKHNRSTALPQTYTTRQPYQTITNTSPTSPKHRQHITRQINCNYVVWSVEYIYNIYILYIPIYNKTEILKMGCMIHERQQRSYSIEISMCRNIVV